MICYKDRTFCDFSTCAKSKNCYNYLTENHKQQAKQMGLDISRHLNKPDCFESRIDAIGQNGNEDYIIK